MSLHRIEKVCEILTVKKGTIWLWVKEKKFPPPIKLGKISVWSDEDIDIFIKNATEESRK